VTILPYQHGGYIRFISERTGETLFEITMLDGAIIIWGSHYRPDEFKASLAGDGATVSVAGILRDRVGAVVISRSASTSKQAFVWNSGVSGGLRPVVPSRPHVTAEPRD
jgi:hypothetical protein